VTSIPEKAIPDVLVCLAHALEQLGRLGEVGEVGEVG
jgi:hypothetical protein